MPRRVADPVHLRPVAFVGGREWATPTGWHSRDQDLNGWHMLRICHDGLWQHQGRRVSAQDAQRAVVRLGLRSRSG